VNSCNDVCSWVARLDWCCSRLYTGSTSIYNYRWSTWRFADSLTGLEVTIPSSRIFWVTGLAFLDLTKVLDTDTVNHALLLQKLSNCGVDDVAKDWFTSLVTNRKQVNSCNDVCSGVARLDWCCSRLYTGSTSIYNYQWSTWRFAVVTLYAVDTVPYLASKSTADLQSKINTDLKGEKLNYKSGAVCC